MKNGKPTLLLQLIATLTLTLTIAYAGTILTSKADKPLVSYTHLSTAQLQKKVEELANKDKLPFEMGLELIKRWQSKSVNNTSI